MKKTLTNPILTGIAGLALAASAQVGANGLSSPDRPHGVVRTDVERKAEQIFPVRIVEIDGDLVSADNKVALWLKPGEHTIKVRGHLRQDFAGGVQRTVGSGKGTNELQINVEEGKVHYIGGQKSPDTGNAWTPVVWKVEPAAAKRDG